MLYQQGDVILEAVKTVPMGAEKVPTKNGCFVLAEGEVTGHSHTVVADPGVDLMKLGDELFLSNTETIEIKHQEHHKVALPPGTWKVRRVREYDHFAEEARQVKD